MLRRELERRFSVNITLWVVMFVMLSCSRSPAPPSEHATQPQTEQRPADQTFPRLAIAVEHLERKPSCPEGLPISIQNIQTFDWRSCEIDLKPFWRNLRIPSKSFNNSTSISDVSSITGDLDGDGINERILRMELRTVSTEQTVRFIVLKGTGNEPQSWRGITHIDVDYFHLEPQARVESNGRGHWLVISENEAAWGTNLYQEDEEWYTLKDGALVKALKFPVKGDWAFFWRPDLFGKFETTVRIVPFDGEKDRLELELNGDFGIGGKFSIEAGGASDTIPFQITHKVMFSKSPNDAKFRFDAAESEIPESTFTHVYNIDSGDLSNSAVLKFAYPALLQLVSDHEQPELIRKFLSEVRDSKEKRALLRSLH